MRDTIELANVTCIHCGNHVLHDANILVNDDGRTAVGARCEYCEEITFVEVCFDGDGGLSVSACRVD
uniref:hypothetical protein n=1 Tax=Synechococcus sp. UW106 TaxID=368495 RepID=UPI000E0E7104|nr:hypothetical protein [Synechococcus sp. UW106]